MNDMFGDSSSDDEGPTVPDSGLSLPCAKVATTTVYGGGRGLFAMRNLQRGELVMSELPLIRWDQEKLVSDPMYLLAQVNRILNNAAHRQACACLHPMTLNDADDEEIAIAAARLGLTVPTGASNTTPRTQSQTEAHTQSRDDDDTTRLRLALALQHNGFSSGLYVEHAMLNHSCDAPNCIRVSPSGATAFAGELWTTRAVTCGEQLLITYPQPREEQTSSALAAYLWQHHRFVCAAGTCSIHTRGGNADELIESGGSGHEDDDEGMLQLDEFVDACTSATAAASGLCFSDFRNLIAKAEMLISGEQEKLKLKLKSQGQGDGIGKHVFTELSPSPSSLLESERASPMPPPPTVIKLHRAARDLSAAILQTCEATVDLESDLESAAVTTFLIHARAWLKARDALSLRDANISLGVKNGRTDANDGPSGCFDPFLAPHLEDLADVLETPTGKRYVSSWRQEASQLRARAGLLRRAFNMRVKYHEAARFLLNAAPGTCWRRPSNSVASLDNI